MGPVSERAVDIYVDGSSRGNPGPSSIGVIAFACGDDEHPIYEYAKYIGTTTNNIAEYEALIHALAWIMQTRPSRATIHMDSELVYKQLIGTYRVKNERMAVQLKRVKRLRGSLNSVTFCLVPREQNKHANRLAQKASQNHKPNRTTFKQEPLL
jgi:ribonuclease HI